MIIYFLLKICYFEPLKSSNVFLCYMYINMRFNLRKGISMYLITSVNLTRVRAIYNNYINAISFCLPEWQQKPAHSRRLPRINHFIHSLTKRYRHPHSPGVRLGSAQSNGWTIWLEDSVCIKITPYKRPGGAIPLVIGHGVGSRISYRVSNLIPCPRSRLWGRRG